MNIRSIIHAILVLFLATGRVPVSAQINVPTTNAVTEFLPFVGKSDNDIPQEARTTLQELKKSKVPTPDIARDLAFDTFTEEEKNFIRMDARSTFPRVISLCRAKNDMTDGIKKGDLIWLVQWRRVDRPQDKREYIVDAKTGKITTPNKGVQAIGDKSPQPDP